MNLPPELDKIKQQVKRHAIDCGLDFFDVVFEMSTRL